MRRWAKRIVIAITVLLLIGGLASYWAVAQTKVVPEFYAQATKQLPFKTRAASDRLQLDVKQFQQDISRLGSWSAAFSDEEINAWLVEELPKRFPELLARGMEDPRIAIEEDRILVAARYQDRRFDTIVSFEVEVELTEEANMLALRLKNLRAGALPMPLNKFLKGITREAARGDIDVKWDMTQSGPIALVNVPREHPGYVATPVIVESVRLVEGALLLAGHTGSLAEQAFKPRGPVHQFVSYNPNSRRSRQESSVIR